MSSEKELAELKGGHGSYKEDGGGGNSSEQDADIIHIDSAFAVFRT